MRPVPSQRHYWAVLILVATVAANAAISSLEVVLTPSQANLLCESYKAQDSSALPNDTVFGSGSSLWRLHLPAWQSVLASAVRVAGWFTHDPVQIPHLAILLLAGLSLLLYLLSMYWLLYRQTRIWSVSVLVAILSTAIFSPRQPAWGIGPAFAVGPEFLYRALIPLIALLLVRWRHSYLVVAAFFLAGVWGNFEPVSGVTVLLIMLIGFLASRRFRPLALLQGLLGLLAGVIALSPAIFYSIATFYYAGAKLVRMPLADLRETLLAGGVDVLYPGLLADTLRFLALAAIIGTPSLIILFRLGRYRVRDISLWVWLTAGAVVVSLGLQGLMQALAVLTGRVPPCLEFIAGLPIAMLPLWVLFTQAMVSLIRISRTHRLWTRLALAAFAVIFLASSRNVAPLRHRVDMAMGTESSERHSTALAEAAEMQAIGRWAATTGPGSLFLTTESEPRYIGRRSVWVNPADVLYFFHLQPQALPEFGDMLDRLNDLLRPAKSSHVDSPVLVAQGQQLQRGLFMPGEVYAIVQTSQAPPADEHLQPVADPAGQWGKFWRVYHVLP